MWEGKKEGERERFYSDLSYCFRIKGKLFYSNKNILAAVCIVYLLIA